MNQKVKRSLYVAAISKMAGELAELEAKEVLLTTSPVYITSKDHDHADHIKELKNNLMEQTELKGAIQFARGTLMGDALPKKASNPPSGNDRKNS